jgi:hypothetical protein
MADMVEMEHDGEEDIVVTEEAARVHELSGWRIKDAEKADTAPEPRSRSERAAPREPAEQDEEEE